MIKVSNLRILCIQRCPNIKDKKMFDRIILPGNKKARFVTKHKKIHFTNLADEGFKPGYKIRFFEHHIDPKHKFFIQVKSDVHYETLSIEEKKQFFTLTKTKDDSTSSTVSVLFTTLGITEDKWPESFVPSCIVKQLSDEGYLFEIDLTGPSFPDLNQLD